MEEGFQTKTTCTPDAANVLVEQYQGYARFVVQRMIRCMNLPQSLSDDLTSAAYEGLVLAARAFDPDRGSGFKNYAFIRIRGAIIDSIRKSSDISRHAYRHARAWEASHQLREELESLPAPQGSSSEKQRTRLAQILDYASYSALAFRLSLSDVDEESTPQLKIDENPEALLEHEEQQQRIQKIIATLPVKERTILWKLYFAQKSLSEIAEESNGTMSKSWVTRVHVRALRRFRQRYLEMLLAEGLDPCPDADPRRLPGRNHSRRHRK